MQNYQDFFSGKRITLMGLGLLGRGVGDAAFLASYGADLVVTDLKPENELESSLQELKAYKNITYVLGEHLKRDFIDRDLIIKAPKTPLDSPYIAAAKNAGVPVTMSTALFAKLSGTKTIGVTGTRGKSTVARLIFEILKQAGKEVLLGGNIRGISTLALLPQVSKQTLAVLELDSWQLQGFEEEKISPNIAIFTTFFPDHLDYYKGDLDLYRKDKASIFLHQKPNDTLIIGSQAVQLIKEKYGPSVVAKILKAGAKDVPDDWKLSIPGEHNRYNAGCAVAAARVLKIEDSIIRQAVEKFKGVPGRLEKIKEENGIAVYNDNSATTPEATIAALEALDSGENIILVAGGSDKRLELEALSDAIKKHTKQLVLLSGTGTDKLKQFLSDTTYTEHKTLADAIKEAKNSAQGGDTILFSPAFASFGMFKNEYDRNDEFVRLIEMS